jgi:hypothetical protein
MKSFIIYILKIITIARVCFIVDFANAQTIDKDYSYKNFDDSQVQISLKIDQEFVHDSNQNWYELITTNSNKEENYDALVKTIFLKNKDSLRFIYEMFTNSLPKVSESYFINSVIFFVQSIPYKIPPLDYKEKKTSGLLAPAICLIEGYGDCDTKSLLLCCILAHKYELIYLTGARHVFIGIKIPPTKNQEYVEINGVQYVLCEMTSKWELGKLPVSSIDDINKGKYRYQILKY